jgi:hypothetical protein
VKERIHDFRIGHAVRVELLDKDLNPGQWFEAPVKAVSHDCVWLDLNGVNIYYADGTYAQLEEGFNVEFQIGKNQEYRTAVNCTSVDGSGNKCEECWAAKINRLPYSA